LRERVTSGGRDRLCERSPKDNVPSAPDHGDECPICQVLAQPVAAAQVSIPVVSLEYLEYAYAVSVSHNLFVVVIDPVSRGPPTV
jgi:hypothetical protein